MPDWMLAAVTGLGSAAALELLRHVLARVQKVTEKQMDDATSFRHDLLARIAALEKDATQSSSERNEWMERYYAERELRVKAQWKLDSVAANSPDLNPTILTPVVADQQENSEGNSTIATSPEH